MCIKSRDHKQKKSYKLEGKWFHKKKSKCLLPQWINMPQRKELFFLNIILYFYVT